MHLIGLHQLAQALDLGTQIGERHRLAQSGCVLQNAPYDVGKEDNQDVWIGLSRG
ncbi:hypothetical protein ACIHFC_33350 [Streptomyces sp. NPDC052013]|uniref:hypothetical protein n=1 Tax=Streptomyces sp. NPDC052013 TaxID=3365679 RepID=UPI0037CE951F